MPKRLDGLTGKRFESIVIFMREVEDAGFTNELDNGRVMKALHEKIEEIWDNVERKGSYYVTTRLRPHPLHTSELVVTLNSDIKDSVKTELILFVRKERDSIAVRRDVLEDEVPIGKSDMPYHGITVNFTQASRLFKEKNRFNAHTLAAFDAVYVAVTALSVGKNCMLRISPLASGLDVKYLIDGRKFTSVRYEYNH